MHDTCDRLGGRSRSGQEDIFEKHALVINENTSDGVRFVMLGFEYERNENVEVDV